MAVVIDAAYFPHILDEIITQADPAALISLRAVSSELRTRCDELLTAHLVWNDGNLFIPTPRSRSIPNGNDTAPHQLAGIKVPALRYGLLPIFEQTAFFKQLRTYRYPHKLGVKFPLDYFTDLSQTARQEQRQRHMRFSPFAHPLSYRECDAYYALFQKVMGSVQVLDIQQPIHTVRQGIAFPALLGVKKRVPVLRFWPVHENAPGLLKGSLLIEAETIVLCCFHGAQATLSSPQPSDSSDNHQPMPTPISYSNYTLAATSPGGWCPPKRLVIHINNTMARGLFYSIFVSRCLRHRAFATREVVYVAHSLNGVYHDDLLHFLTAFLYRPRASGTGLEDFKVIIVNPTARIPKAVLKKMALSQELKRDWPSFGELAKRLANREGPRGFVERHFHFVSMEQWEMQLGAEQFAVEMGKPPLI